MYFADQKQDERAHAMQGRAAGITMSATVPRCNRHFMKCLRKVLKNL
jgi:hypothetical protein